VCGRGPQLPISLKFDVPQSRYPVMETEFGKGLAKELNYARVLAKKSTEAAQKVQKQHYDQQSKHVDLKLEA